MKVQLNDIRARSTWEGKEPRHHSPALDYCRKLIKEGVDPKEKLEVYRGEMLAYSMVIEEGAKWKILEDEERGPTFKRYRPFPDALKGQRCGTVTSKETFK